jgi:hypothetical protein
MAEARIRLMDGGREIGVLTRKVASEAEAAAFFREVEEHARRAREWLDRPLEERMREALASPLARLDRKTPNHQVAAAPSDG